MQWFKRNDAVNAILVLLICGFGSGCSPSEQRPDLYPADGMLLINNKPATGAYVIFYPADNRSIDERGTLPKATVGEDGSFDVTTYQAGDGIPAGDYNLGIIWLDNPESSHAADKLQGRFAVPERSNLKATILPEDNTLDPIKLERVSVSHRNANHGQDPHDPDQVD